MEVYGRLSIILHQVESSCFHVHVLKYLMLFLFFISCPGTDEDVILMLLTARSNDQRQQIKAAYKKAYGKVR